MRVTTMLRRPCAIFAALTLAGLSATSLSAGWYYGYGYGPVFVSPGLNYYWGAVGESIHVNTMMRLNEYIYQSIKEANRENAAIRAAKTKRRREDHEKIMDRIKNHPEELDVLKGDALNALREQLAGFSSALRASPVPLSSETIRTIPFMYGPRDAVISLRRLTIRKWPIAFRPGSSGDPFFYDRKAFETAIQTALDQMLDGKTSREAILAVEKAINNLDYKIDKVFDTEEQRKDKTYIQAKQTLRELTTAKELLKDQKVEQIIGEMNRYSGTTLQDLLEFMQRNNLRFYVPDIGDERELYSKLNEKMKLALEAVNIM
jgi:hypothetical protein